eukprot:g52017.t1
MVAAEMVVQIAEAVGMGTHYWTPERLDASRLMASTEGMVDLNIARLGQVQVKVRLSVRVAVPVTDRFVQVKGLVYIVTEGCQTLRVQSLTDTVGLVLAATRAVQCRAITEGQCGIAGLADTMICRERDRDWPPSAQ